MMEFVQKKKSNKLTFTLHDEYFNFAYVDNSGAGDIDINYADLPQKSSVQIEQNEWFRNVGYLWIAIGTFEFVRAIFSSVTIAANGVWLTIGSGSLIWFYFSKVKYTVFRTGRGNILVIQDKKHDKIIAELNKRRKSQLLAWYGDVNPKNSLEQEIQKFNWLVEQKILSKEESDIKIAQAELLQKADIQLPREKLN